jgi:hypothetical protein
MTSPSDICSKSHRKNSQVSHACTCCYPAVLICESCILSHLSQPKLHTFISLDFSKELIHDRELQKHLLQNFSKANLIQAEVQDYIDKITDFKLSVSCFESEIISLIQSECSAKIKYLDEIQTDAEKQLESIKSAMANCSAFGDRLASSYELYGLRGILNSYAEKLEIHKDLIHNAVKSMILIGSSTTSHESQPLCHISEIHTSRSESNSCIFIAKNSTKSLVKYDARSNTSFTSDLSDYISDNFSGSATSILPDGSVMIVGGCRDQGTHYLGDTFRYDISSQTCAKLSNLSVPRCIVSLFYHSGFLYAFGGYAGMKSKTAERLDINKNRWIRLPEMCHGRCLFGSYYRDSKLYLFGGDDAKTVEYYDFKRNQFEIIQNLSVPRGCSVVAEYQDRIYFISHSNLMVINKEFDVVEEKRGLYHIDLYNLSNTVVRNGKIVFYSRNDNKILGFDTRMKKIQVMMKI